MRADFLPEAGGEAGVANGKLLGLEPFVSQEGCDGLLRGSNQVLLVDGAVVGLLAALPDDLRHTGDDEEQEESEDVCVTTENPPAGTFAPEKTREEKLGTVYKVNPPCKALHQTG